VDNGSDSKNKGFAGINNIAETIIDCANETINYTGRDKYNSRQSAATNTSLIKRPVAHNAQDDVQQNQRDSTPWNQSKNDVSITPVKSESRFGLYAMVGLAVAVLFFIFSGSNPSSSSSGTNKPVASSKPAVSSSKVNNAPVKQVKLFNSAEDIVKSVSYINGGGPEIRKDGAFIKGKLIIWDNTTGKLIKGFDNLAANRKWESSWQGAVTIFRITSYDDELTGNYTNTGAPGYRRTANIDVIVLPEKRAIGKISIVGDYPPKSISYKRGSAPKNVYGEIDKPIINWADSIRQLGENESLQSAIDASVKKVIPPLPSYNVPASKPVALPEPDDSGIIVGTDVRFRSGPGSNYTVLGYFDDGEDVTVLDSQGGWLEIEREDGSVGWVSSKYCVY